MALAVQKYFQNDEDFQELFKLHGIVAPPPGLSQASCNSKKTAPSSQKLTDNERLQLFNSGAGIPLYLHIF